MFSVNLSGPSAEGLKFLTESPEKISIISSLSRALAKISLSPIVSQRHVDVKYLLTHSLTQHTYRM